MESYIQALDNLWNQHLAYVNKIKHNHAISINQQELEEQHSLEIYNSKKNYVISEFLRKKNQKDHVSKTRSAEALGIPAPVQTHQSSREKFYSNGKLENHRQNIHIANIPTDHNEELSSCDDSMNSSLTSSSSDTQESSLSLSLGDLSTESHHNDIEREKKKLTKGASRRSQYPMAFKLLVINEYDRIIQRGGVSNVQEKVAVMMDISQSLVSKWVKARQQLQELNLKNVSTIRNRKRSSGFEPELGQIAVTLDQLSNSKQSEILGLAKKPRLGDLENDDTSNELTSDEESIKLS
jgi:hypothetical protein